MSYTQNNYTKLIVSFPPSPIKSEEDLEKVQNIVDSLLDKEKLTEDEEDYLYLLGMLIEEYEEKQDLVPDIHGIELIKALMVELDMKQKDLIPIFKTESIVSDVLKGKRKMTVEHIQKSAELFRLSPAVFFPDN